MKKLISSIILTVLIFTMCITAASAENAVEKYAEILTGDWVSLTYWGAPQSIEESFNWLRSFTYPHTPENPDVDMIQLVGNDSGSVYLLMVLVPEYGGFHGSYYQACGEVMFSADGNTMYVDCGDDGHYVYVRK